MEERTAKALSKVRATEMSAVSLLPWENRKDYFLQRKQDIEEELATVEGQLTKQEVEENESFCGE